MTANSRCEHCEMILMAFESLGARPIGGEECPRCGSAEFSFVEE